MNGGYILRRVRKQQVFREFALMWRNGCKPLDLFRVHDREVQTRLRAVIKENRIHHFPRARRQPEENIGNAQRRSNIRQTLLDQSDAFHGLARSAAIVLIALPAWETQ